VISQKFPLKIYRRGSRFKPEIVGDSILIRFQGIKNECVNDLVKMFQIDLVGSVYLSAFSGTDVPISSSREHRRSTLQRVQILQDGPEISGFHPYSMAS
jgi:hypothetical protein